MTHQLPEQYAQMRRLLLNPTRQMREVTNLMAKGIDHVDAANEVDVNPELVLAWSQLHLGFIARYRHLVWLGQERLANSAAELDALRTESDIEIFEMAMVSNQPPAPSRGNGLRVKRSPAPLSAEEMLAELVEVVLVVRREDANDFDILDGDLLSRHYWTRHEVEAEIVQERLDALANIEEDPK